MSVGSQIERKVNWPLFFWSTDLFLSSCQNNYHSCCRHCRFCLFSAVVIVVAVFSFCCCCCCCCYCCSVLLSLLMLHLLLLLFWWSSSYVVVFLWSLPSSLLFSIIDVAMVGFYRRVCCCCFLLFTSLLLSLLVVIAIRSCHRRCYKLLLFFVLLLFSSLSLFLSSLTCMTFQMGSCGETVGLYQKTSGATIHLTQSLAPGQETQTFTSCWLHVGSYEKKNAIEALRNLELFGYFKKKRLKVAELVCLCNERLQTVCQQFPFLSIVFSDQREKVISLAMQKKKKQ